MSERGTVVLVTGGSRGIGAATSALAAERGWAVCVNYRDRRETAEAVVSSIASAGGRAVAVQADVSVETEGGRRKEEGGRRKEEVELAAAGHPRPSGA